jgi:hypothetical protein
MCRTQYVTVLVFVVGWVSLPQVAQAVVIGQLDDFEDGTTQGWTEGMSISPPTVSSPGPDGSLFLHDVSTGLFRAGSRMVVFNEQAWTGDYLSAQVVAIEMDVNNLGETDLFLRIGLGTDIPGTSPRQGYVSQTPVHLSSGSGWQHVTFEIDAVALVGAGGPPPLEAVLANATQFRIISSAGVDWRGDRIAATIGVDNIRALGVPEPGACVLFILGALTLVTSTRRRGRLLRGASVAQQRSRIVRRER